MLFEKVLSFSPLDLPQSSGHRALPLPLCGPSELLPHEFILFRGFATSTNGCSKCHPQLTVDPGALCYWAVARQEQKVGGSI